MNSMRMLRLGFVALGLSGLILADAQEPAADTTLQVIATDPGLEAALHTDDAFSVQLRYQSTTAFRLRILGRNRGATMPGLTHASPRYGPGHGNAIAWLAFRQPAQVDSLLLVAENSANGHVLASLTIPVQLQWRADDSIPRLDAADWVQNLNNAAQRAIATEIQPAPMKPESDWGTVLLQLGFLMVPGYLVLQLALPWLLRGGWRKAAWAPAVVMTPLFGFVIFATYVLNANLAPLWLVIACPPAILYLVIVTVLFWLKQKRARTVS